MLVSLPVVLGVIALHFLGLDLFPDVEFPIVIVSTNRPGTGVEEMETSVTKIVEEAVNTVSGIDELRSTTKEGMSLVTVQFVLTKNRDVAHQEVQSKINTILNRLPTGTDPPVVTKFDFDASPVMFLSATSPRPLRELTEIVDKRIKDNLSNVDGVGAITMIGGCSRAINVTVDTARLEACGLSIDDVRRALVSQNLELPGGRVDQQYRELMLRTMGRVTDPRDFADIIVANINGQPIRISDLGGEDVVEDSFQEPRSLARRDGENTVLLTVQKQSGTNIVAVTDAVEARLKSLETILASEGRGDIRLGVERSQAKFIKASMHEVNIHLLLGAALVILTILLFLRNWRTTLIAAIAIPASLVAAFPAMWALGLTLNNITLISLVLIIGIVVDDAIIITENIFRWMEEKGASAREAALRGTKEITLAVVATTSSLVVIFLPIAFMSGAIGMFLKSFGVTCAIAVLASLLVSLTMTPMLASRFMKLSRRSVKAQETGRSHHSGGAYGWLIEKPYLASLRWAMRHRLAVVLLTVATVASVFPLPVGRWLSFGNEATAERLAGLNFPGLIGLVGYDFVPKDDEGQFMINVTTPAGWTLEKTASVCGDIQRRLAAWPEITHVTEFIGDTTGMAAKGEGAVTQAGFLVTIQDLAVRSPPFAQWQIMKRSRELMVEYPELRSAVVMPSAMSGFTNADMEFVLAGPDLARLNDYADRIVAKLRRTKGLADVDTTLLPRQRELRLAVNRDRASDLGVSIQGIASTLRTLVGGEIVTDYRDNDMGEQYDVWLRARGTDRGDAAAVSNLILSSSKGGLVRLNNVATTEEELGPSQIDRSQRQRKISIIANLAGMPGDVAARTFMEAFKELDAPPNYSMFATGRAKAQAESVVAFMAAFLLALVFMYMILAAQFESFLQPVTILLAAPLTIPFALLSQIFLGQPLTLFSVLGVFLLFGIVKKNGILQIDYTNVLRRAAATDVAVVPDLYRLGPAGLAAGARPGRWVRWVLAKPEYSRVRLWAILEANRIRLRPILMTTIVLVSAMIPVALGKGPGAANRADMAKVIVGGQAMSLLLTLLVTPVSYSLLDDLSRWILRRMRRGEPAESPAEPAADA
jgi:HAE1 family hydrophobic/amphiphilic exporter-1